jgi:hypothetical protein
MTPDIKITDFVDIGSAALLAWLLIRAWAENQRLTSELTKLAQTTVQMLERVDQGLKRIEGEQLKSLEEAIKEKNGQIAHLISSIQDMATPIKQPPARRTTRE